MIDKRSLLGGGPVVDWRARVEHTEVRQTDLAEQHVASLDCSSMRDFGTSMAHFAEPPTRSDPNCPRLLTDRRTDTARLRWFDAAKRSAYFTGSRLDLVADAFERTRRVERNMASTLAPGQLFTLDALVTTTAQGIASRVLARTAGGNITLFAFDAGEELSEHTAPFDALALTMSGALVLTVGGAEIRTAPQTIVLMPANVPHAVHAVEASRLVLIMLREAA